MRAVAQLRRYENDPRVHGEAQIAQIAASIKEFGWTSPLLINEKGRVIAGGARLLAAQKLGLKEVPCIVLAGLSNVQEDAYRVTDNKLPENASWDEESLRTELARIASAGFALDLTGFSVVEYEQLLKDIDVKVDIESLAGNADQTGEPPSAFPAPRQDDEDDIAAPAAPGHTGKLPTKAPDADPDGDKKEPDWPGMPEFEQPDAGPYRTIRVHFKDQAAVDSFAQLVGQTLTEKTKYIWHPKQVKRAAPGLVYE